MRNHWFGYYHSQIEYNENSATSYMPVPIFLVDAQPGRTPWFEPDVFDAVWEQCPW